MMPRIVALAASIVFISGLAASQQKMTKVKPPPGNIVVSLVTPASVPFHLQAQFSAEGEPDKGSVEIFWLAPDKYRRTIKSPEFSQTLIVNGNKVFEDNSDDYFPLWLQTLSAAVVDSEKVLRTAKAGMSTLIRDRDGIVDHEAAFDYGPKVVATGPYGTSNVVKAPGHSMGLRHYQEFQGKGVPTSLYLQIDPGYSVSARIVLLETLDAPDPKLFQIVAPTASEDRLRSVAVSEADFRKALLSDPEIIWPQVLDGAITGPTSFYVSTDRTGRVREVQPFETANERSNDSAVSQIMKWRIKATMVDGVPVQTEALLNFTLDTRAYGPAEPLSDDEIRKLATNMVEPRVAPGTVPPGSTKAFRVAVDFEGNVYEVIAGDGPAVLGKPCHDALSKWHFPPYMQDGKPRPYRAEVIFRF